MQNECQENTELEGIKTPSFPVTTIPYGIDEDKNFICAVFGYNEQKSQFYIDIPVSCNQIKEYVPPTYKSMLSAMNPQEAKRREKAASEITKNVLDLIEHGYIDRALELIQFHKLKF